MRRFSSLSIILSCIFILNLFCPAVSAEDLQYNEFWGYYFADEYCGVDYSQYQSTDEGSSLWDIIQRYGTNTAENTINFYVDSVQNAMKSEGADEWAINQVGIYGDFAKNTLQNTVTTGTSVANYTNEKISRTFVDGDKRYLNVSGDDFFNSIYNDLFNNNGYQQQYEETTSDRYSGTVSGVSFSVEIVQGSYSNFPYGDQSTVIGNIYNNYRYVANNYCGLLHWVVNGENFYSNFSNQAYFVRYELDNVYIDGDYIYVDIKIPVTDSYIVTASQRYQIFAGSNTDNNVEPDNGQIPKPQSCGVIRYGDQWVDVPVDPEERPQGWVLNPPGTVTIDGQEYPIYIEIGNDEDGSGGGEGGDGGESGDGDDGQLTPDGVFQIIKTIGNTPFGNIIGNNPNEQYNNPDGNNNGNPFGLDIGGFFGNIAKAVGNGIQSLFGGVIELLKKLLELIKSLFSLNWLSQLTSVQTDLDFNILTNIFDEILQGLGVDY